MQQGGTCSDPADLSPRHPESVSRVAQRTRRGFGARHMSARHWLPNHDRLLALLKPLEHEARHGDTANRIVFVINAQGFVVPHAPDDHHERQQMIFLWMRLSCRGGSLLFDQPGDALGRADRHQSHWVRHLVR